MAAAAVSKTFAEWAVSTFVLAVGQIGYDSTNNVAKIGNGIDYFIVLPIASANEIIVTLSDESNLELNQKTQTDLFNLMIDELTEIKTILKKIYQ